MKTTDYRMEINVLDTIKTTVRISKKVYEQKLASLKRQAAESKNACEPEFVAEEKEYTEEFNQYFRDYYRVTLGTTDIELIAIRCKPGYHFGK